MNIPSWMTTVDNIASLVHVNDGIVNKGYRPLKQEDISDEEIQ
jgi:hypothetical protein